MVLDVKNTTNVSDIAFGEFTNGCLHEYNIVACTRDIIESVFALVTGIVCLLKIVKLHLAKHELWNQYLIFYGAILEILLLTVNWIYAHHPSIDLVAELFKLFQFLVVCRFYCEIASRISKTEYLYKRFFVPFLLFTSTYYSVLIVVSIARMKDERECQQPEWLQLSCSEVVLGIIFAVVGIYITTHINGLRTDATHKRSLKRSLWGIILSFEVSSLISASYDVLMIFYGDVNECRGMFVTDPALFTVTHVLLKLVKWLLPIWAMIFYFKIESFRGSKTSDDVPDDEPPIIRNSLIQDFTSEFRPRNRSFNYKHLRDPENEDEHRIVNNTTSVPENPDMRKKQKEKRKKRNETSNSSTGGSSVGVPDENKNKKWVRRKKSQRNKENSVISINSGDIVEVPSHV